MPSNITELSQLPYLNLSKNIVSGQIPETIGSFLLEQLDLSDNLLEGGIPEQLAVQSQLNVLKLGRNNLSGPVCTGNQLHTFSNDSFLPGNDGLCRFPLPTICPLPGTSKEPDSRNGSESLIKDDFSSSGFVLGLVIGFVSVGRNFIRWRLARGFVYPNHLKIRRITVHNNAVGMWGPRL